MIENLKNLLNAKNLLIITVSLIICYIFFNIFLYENFGEELKAEREAKYATRKAIRAYLEALKTKREALQTNRYTLK